MADYNFLEVQRNAMQHLGFWTEEYRRSFIDIVESTYRKEITDKWQISDIVPNGDMFLIKWVKRIIPAK